VKLGLASIHFTCHTDRPERGLPPYNQEVHQIREEDMSPTLPPLSETDWIGLD